MRKTCCYLGDGSGLANAGGTDQCNPPAFGEQVAAIDRQAMRNNTQRLLPDLVRVIIRLIEMGQYGFANISAKTHF